VTVKLLYVPILTAAVKPGRCEMSCWQQWITERRVIGKVSVAGVDSKLARANNVVFTTRSPGVGASWPRSGPQRAGDASDTTSRIGRENCVAEIE